MKPLKLLLFSVTLFSSLFFANRSANATGGSACNCENNPLANPGFEDGFKGWTKEGGKTENYYLLEKYKVCEKYAGIIDARDGARKIYQDVLLVAGSDISFSYYGGTHDNSKTHEFRLTYYNSDGGKITSNQNIVSAMNHEVGNGSTLKKYSFTSKAPVRAYKVRIEFYAKGSYYKLDALCLKITPPDYCVDCDDNRLVNASFEDGIKNWQVSGKLVIEKPFKVCGENAAVLHGIGSFWQDVEVKQGSLVNLRIFGAYHSEKGQKFELIFLDENSKEMEDAKEFVLIKKYVYGNPWGLAQYNLSATAPSKAHFVRVKGSSPKDDFLKVDAACLSVTDPLPVTLSSFRVVKELESANLIWSTVAETNAREFEVQHSQNGKEWAKIAVVDAKGESAELMNYSYIHTNPFAGNNLYRLKMIDADDTYAFSKIVNLNIAEGKISVFPNPTTDRIKFSGNGQDVKNVQLFAMNGVMVLNATLDSSNEVNLAKLAQGSYIVKINKADGTTSSQKIQIVR